MISRKLINLSLACAAVMLIGQIAANAQDQGYQFGVGWGYSNYGNSPYLRNKGEIPYFALHPPVYYSEQIVRRPYGISPYAAPPGIMPTEMIVAPQPIVIENPYVKPQGTEDLPEKPIAPKKKPQPKKPQPKADDKKKDDVKARTSDPNQWNFVIKNQFFIEQTPPALVVK